MILFVCTGNTCRSAMAHVLARDVFEREGITEEIYSCGTSALLGEAASDGAKEAVQAYGCRLDGHSASILTEELINNAGLILTMTGGHMLNVCRRFPRSDGKIYTLKGFLYGEDGDISDPYGGDSEVYKSCAEEIYTCITKLAEILKEGCL